MRGLLIGLGLATALSACAAPYEAMPQSGYQWQRRQDQIERDWQASQPPVAAPVTTPAPKDPS